MKPKRLALDINGKITWCYAKDENFGKGACTHITHQNLNESQNDFLNRTEKYFHIVNGQRVLNLAKTNDAIQKEHNQKAYLEAKEALEKYGKCAIVQATGTGKSSVFTSIADDYSDEKCILICPLNGIKDQFIEHNTENDVMLKNNLVCLSYSRIQQLVSEGKLDALDEEFGIKGNSRLIMLDELHRSGAKEWSKGINEFIEWAKKDEKVKILGASATPKRDDGTDPSSEFCGGIKVSNLGIEEAIQKDILPMPNYIGVKGFEEQKFREFISNVSKDKNMDSLAKNRCYAFIMGKSQKYVELDNENSLEIKENLQNKINENNFKNKGTKILIFCKDKDDANNGFGKESIERLKKDFPDLKIEYSTYLSGDKGNSKKFYDKFVERHRKVQKGKIEVLIAVNKFNEGIHAPDVETIFMGRETKSNIIYQQQIGRVLTSDSNAGEPLIFDFAGNFKSSDIDLEKLQEMKNKQRVEANQEKKNWIKVKRTNEYLNDLKEIEAYIASEKKNGRYKAGKYKGKYRTINDIYLEERGELPTKSQLNKFKINIDNGKDFEEAYEDSIWY